MSSPVKIGVPISCFQRVNAEEKIQSWRYPYPPPLEEPLPVRADAPSNDQDNTTWHTRLRLNALAAPIALGTVVEYATITYGSERLPMLLAALPHHESWKTLLPTVFGVSLTEFEKGWRGFLADHYGISQ
jgi:hypothetical protein